VTYFKDLPKWVVVLSVAALLPFILAVVILLMTWAGLFGPIPNTDELKDIQYHRGAVVVTSDGVDIGRFQTRNHSVITLDEVSPHMTDALLAIEDIRFHQHNGIDYRALGRVLVRTIILQQNAGGGSTLTQQLVKNLYPRNNRSGLLIVTDKLREMITARRLESVYTKEEILELYLNTVSFGEDTYGIEMGSYRFFNKPPSDLTLTESATLAGLLQATTLFNPYRSPERSLQRRNIVIAQMARYGMITEEEAAESISSDLEVDYNRSALANEMAPYFREQLRRKLIHILANETALDGNQYSLYEDGLEIHTTLDSRMQRSAEKALREQMSRLQQIFDRELEQEPVFGLEDPDVLRVWQQSEQFRVLKKEGYSDEEIEEILHTPVATRLFTWDGYEEAEISPYDEIRYYISFLNAGLIAISPDNGDILAWVGGIDYRHFQYDQVLARRQPGSAFKPVLYTAALENGRSPCDYQRNMLARFTDFDDWTPQNVDEEYGGRYSLQAALARSVNTVAVHLAMETGIPNIQQTAARLGITTPLPEAPSIALGTSPISLLELTSAYTAFLNQGVPVQPAFVKKIYNGSGELIYDFSDSDVSSGLEYMTGSRLMNNLDPLTSALYLTENSEHPSETVFIPPSGERLGISPDVAAAMTAMLEKAVNEGTGAPLRSRFGITHALGGKTGTTQNFTDGWFTGFTPEIVFGVRVGGWNNRVRFREFPAYASQTALPVAGLFLQNLEQETSLPPQPMQFTPDQVDTHFSLTCPDYRDDRVRDRLRDFFTGRSSDEPREIGSDEEDEKKSRNIFRRLGRSLGISGN
jgi:penicillin-binding protein 1A